LASDQRPSLSRWLAQDHPDLGYAQAQYKQPMLLEILQHQL
jgi:hypothetical protein